MQTAKLLISAIATLILISPVQARHHYAKHHSHKAIQSAAIGPSCVPDNNGHMFCGGSQLGHPDASPMGRKHIAPTRGPDFASKGCRGGTIHVMTAYGIGICVDPRYASNFQSFFESLKASGAKVTNIVCQAYGHAHGSNHDGGGACDVNQRRKNVTIPAMYHVGAMIRAAGLHDGCNFRDCGHIEAMTGLCNYGQCSQYSARHHRRYASRVTQVR